MPNLVFPEQMQSSLYRSRGTFFVFSANSFQFAATDAAAIVFRVLDNHRHTLSDDFGAASGTSDGIFAVVFSWHSRYAFFGRACSALNAVPGIAAVYFCGCCLPDTGMATTSGEGMEQFVDDRIFGCGIRHIVLEKTIRNLDLVGGFVQLAAQTPAGLSSGIHCPANILGRGDANGVQLSYTLTGDFLQIFHDSFLSWRWKKEGPWGRAFLVLVNYWAFLQLE